LGVTVGSLPEQVRPITREKTQHTAHLINPAVSITDADIRLDGAQLGEGYGIPTQAMQNAVRRLASTEGIVIDPVYGGKAFAGLVQGIADGSYGPGQNVLFLMTGGLPGLFAYRSAFAGN
jgi:D-cysteine desulfhydrase